LYVLKSINKVDGDWKFRKLHLFHPSTSEGKVNKRRRRLLLRHARQKELGCSQLQGVKVC
jgi:hypothetical protein